MLAEEANVPPNDESLLDAFWGSLRLESENSTGDMHFSHGSLVSEGGTKSDANVSGDNSEGGNAGAGGRNSAIASKTNRAKGVDAASVGARRKPQRDKKRTRFAPRVKVMLTTGLWEYTDDEMNRVYTSNEDKRRNQKNIVETVQWMRENAANAPDEEGMCCRGLEFMKNPQGYQERKMSRERVWKAVFAEQERQWIEEYHNSRDIAAASGMLSEKAKKTALLHAMTDEEYVVARRRSSHLRILGGVDSAPLGGRARRRASRVSFERHGDQVLDEIMAVAEKSEAENPAGRRRSVDSEDDENDDSCEDVPVISRIEESIINGEIEAGRMVRNAGDDNDFHASFSFTDSWLGSSQDLLETWAEGGTMATILDDYHSSEGSAVGDNNEDDRSTDDNTPLLEPLKDTSSGKATSPRARQSKQILHRMKRTMTPPVEPGGSAAGTSLLGIPSNGKETFMSAFRRSKQNQQS
eukprot:CAMPEP_0197441808 /NCGR_PEP_ID=MMETSP1175-20131217/7976_1 /TAXON_ID=1003142 /ORGANISM="Triceratium dubium, Strain CCMP147" /LENGTH=466 /DNA_ID=CAMNT_0042972143 /DNA_START=115 /DNA_END=1515 /DNA_ORIENTATION=-